MISTSRSIDSCNKFFFVIFDPVPCYHVIARALQRPRLVAIYEAHQPPHPPAPSRERGAPPHACHTHLSATRRRPRRPADGARRRRGGGARARQHLWPVGSQCTGGPRRVGTEKRGWEAGAGRRCSARDGSGMASTMSTLTFINLKATRLQVEVLPAPY